MTEIPVWVAFLAVGLAIASYFFGIMNRDRTHCVLPIIDPVFMILLTASLMPMILSDYIELPFDPFDPSLLVCLFGWWGGYLIGYFSVKVDLTYYTINKIVDNEQETEFLVRYNDAVAGQCWMPQKFSAVCKALFFNVHNPLDMPYCGNLRKIKVHAYMMPRVKIPGAIDLAGYEERPGQMDLERDGRRIRWRYMELIFTPSPLNTLAPYDWIVQMKGYNELYQFAAHLQVDNIEKSATVQTMMLKAGGQLLQALAMKNPSAAVMEDLEIDLVNRYARKLDNAAEEARKTLDAGDKASRTGRFKRFGKKKEEDDGDA